MNTYEFDGEYDCKCEYEQECKYVCEFDLQKLIS